MKLPGFRRGEKGFTLIEIIIVLAVIAILAAVAIPAVGGYISRGKERAWHADRDILQAAVDSYRTDIGKRAGNPWPTLGKLIGTPVDNATDNTSWGSDGRYNSTGDKDRNLEAYEDLNSFIDIAALATDGYLKSADTVKSANTLLNTTATNTVSGSYGWYIDSKGVVEAIYWDDTNQNHLVSSGEVLTTTVSTSAYPTDIYP